MEMPSFQIVFIGAGPHCLTSLTRLLESSPDDSIDLSQRKVTPKVQVLKYHNKQRTDAKYRQLMTDWLRNNVAVIDPSGKWLARWEQQFTGLGINHLRSSTAVHPDPLDTYSLVTYASSHGRLEERQLLNHVHKNQDFHGPFHTPGSSLFQDFCQDLIYRYCLQDLVMKDKVVDLTPVFAPCTTLGNSSGGDGSCSSDNHLDGSNPPGKPHPPVDHWGVHLASGTQIVATKVVIGIGSTNKQRMPPILQQLQAVNTADESADNHHQADSTWNDGAGTSSSNSSSSFSIHACQPATADTVEAVAEQLQVQTLTDAAGCSNITRQLSTSAARTKRFDTEYAPASGSGSTCSTGAADSNEDISSSWGSISSCNSDRNPDSQQVDSNCGCDESCELAAADCADAAPSAASVTNTGLSTSPQRNSTRCASTSLSTIATNVEQSRMADQHEAPSYPCVRKSSTAAILAAGTYPTGRLLHSWDLAAAVAAAGGSCCSQACSSTGCDPVLQRIGLLYPGESVIILGGGLTSAHLAQMAAAAGASKTTLLLRGESRIKQFDVDLPYMGRLRHKKLQEFRQIKSFDQRLALIKQVLQGGSMPPEAAASLQQLQQSGLLAIQQHSTVVAAEWDWDEVQWDVYLEDGTVLNAHRLWCATGSQVEVLSEPLFKPLLQQFPVPVVSGLPAVQPTLEWCAGSGVFVLGAYAALQLGPGALNLAGAKTASVILEKQLMTELKLEIPGKSNGNSGSSSSRGRSCRAGSRQVP